MKRIVVVFVLAASLAAQQPKPELSRTTQMTIQALATELQQVQKDFLAADELVKKEIPGSHLNGQTLQVEKDAPAKVDPPKK